MAKKMNDKGAIRGKQRSRKLALQALYQWLMSDHELSEIEAQFFAANDMSKVDVEYFRKLLYEVPKNLSAIEEIFTPNLDRPLNDLNPIEFTVLRLGTFELMYCQEIPYRIILDEWVTLAKEFGSIDGHRYVNGVLHQIAKKIRHDS